MAPTRPIRRAVTNENDENNTARVTRAKSAALGHPSDVASGLPAKKALGTKKSISNVQPANKRTALGDVSNVVKPQGAEARESKKPLGIAKTAQPMGVQKISRANSTRSILAPKEKNTVTNDLKRSASGVDNTAVPKKRTKSQLFEEGKVDEDADNEELAAGDENTEPDATAAVRLVTETIKTTTTAADGTKVEKEVKREERIFDAAEKTRQKKIDATIESMDKEDEHDPLMVGEYVYEILDYMKELEVSTAPNPRYMDNQSELEWRMRGVLIDWLLEVHTKFHLLPETFYLTVNIIDRFLSCKFVQLDRLQLVGVTAMFIASKYEEVLSPHIGNFSNVADDGFTDAEILSAERYILAALKYDLSFPNPMHFMRRISKADGYDIQTRTLAKYLLEITLLDHHFLDFLPSMNAAGAMHLARIILEKGSWDDLLEHYSGYTEEEIRPVVHSMVGYLQGTVKHDAFYRKYAAKKFLKASLHARAWAKRYGGSIAEARPETTP